MLREIRAEKVKAVTDRGGPLEPKPGMLPLYAMRRIGYGLGLKVRTGEIFLPTSVDERTALLALPASVQAEITSVPPENRAAVLKIHAAARELSDAEAALWEKQQAQITAIVKAPARGKKAADDTATIDSGEFK